MMDFGLFHTWNVLYEGEVLEEFANFTWPSMCQGD